MPALITLVGARAGKDPEVRFLTDGTAVASFSVAITERKKENDNWVDGTTAWYRVSQFGKQAEATAETVKKGDLLIVTGKLSTSEYDNKEGAHITTMEIRADGVAHMITAGKQTAKQETVSEGNPW